MKIPSADLRTQYLKIQKEIDKAIKQVFIDSAFIGNAKNKYVMTFEKNFAGFCSAKFCIACGNGTDSLEIAVKALGLGPGDEVLVPALSWIATSEAVSWVGAKPIFVDIEPEYFNIDPAKIEEKITPRTKAIIAVHLYGHPAEMPAILKIAQKHHLKIIEDCAQAHGAEISGRRVGTFGDIAGFSFFPGKNLGAYGDAGAIVTNSPKLARQCRLISQHGQLERKHHHYIEGRNSRMDGIQAAVLSIKLKYLDAWTKKRLQHAEEYAKLLADKIILPTVAKGYKHVYNLYVVQTEKRDALQQYLKEQNIETGIHYPTSLPFLAAYKSYHHQPADFPVAYKATKKILSLPMYAELTSGQIKFVTSQIIKFLK